jgi:hypothetical protein
MPELSEPSGTGSSAETARGAARKLRATNGQHFTVNGRRYKLRTAPLKPDRKRSRFAATYGAPRWMNRCGTCG